MCFLLFLENKEAADILHEFAEICDIGTSPQSLFSFEGRNYKTLMLDFKENGDNTEFKKFLEKLTDKYGNIIIKNYNERNCQSLSLFELSKLYISEINVSYPSDIGITYELVDKIS